MAEEAGINAATAELLPWSTSSDSLSTTSQATTTNRLLPSKDGKTPLGLSQLVFWIALPLFVAATALTVPFAVARMENQLESEAVNQLAAAGIDTDGLEINFDYRDGIASGVLPAGLTAAQVDAAVVEEGLLRSFEISAEASTKTAATVADPQTVADADPQTVADADPQTVADADPQTGSGGPANGAEPPAVVTYPVAVRAAFDGDRAIVAGTVLDEDQRSRVLSAVAFLVDPAEVIDELQVTGGKATTPGANARLVGLTTAIAALGGVTGWEADLTDEALAITVDGLVPSSGVGVGGASADATDLDAIYGLPDAIPQIPTTVEVLVRTNPTPRN